MPASISSPCSTPLSGRHRENSALACRKTSYSIQATPRPVGSQSAANRTYINYEIDQSIARGNGIVAIQINELKDKDGNTDPVGSTPAKIEAKGYKVYKYVDHETLAKRIEEAAKAADK